ncbi:hypothetical protein C8R47DRAFT_258568 [Mycena vitilis]|nr:hypothetical protein C8R47DRAFT_258568 [Mycena vitilis]
MYSHNDYRPRLESGGSEEEENDRRGFAGHSRAQATAIPCADDSLQYGLTQSSEKSATQATARTHKPRRKRPSIALFPDQPDTTANTARIRVFLACHQCRSRKIRCDATKPLCHFCSRAEPPRQCAYDQEPKRRSPDKIPRSRLRKTKTTTQPCPPNGDYARPRNGAQLAASSLSSSPWTTNRQLLENRIALPLCGSGGLDASSDIDPCTYPRLAVPSSLFGRAVPNRPPHILRRSPAL